MRTEYAVCYGDFDGNPDYGCYATFDTRGAALDYAVERVLERAAWRESKPLDTVDWSTVLTKEQIRDRLASGMSFPLVDEFTEFSDGTREPEEYVSIRVTEIEHFDR